MLREDAILNLQKRKIKTSSEESCYLREKLIGQGTFGKVYYARDRRNGKVCAIKTVLQDKKYKNRQLSIIILLSHPNIVRMDQYYFTIENYEYYLHIVMEYIPDTLQRIFRENRKQKVCIPPSTRKIFIFQMFKALYYLKLNKICHRDLKPPNILINNQTLQLKICDFGSAKIIQPNEKNVAYICSRYYRAPQLIFGSTDYSIEIDMWSAGCIIVQMITCDPIFPGDSSLQQLIEIIKILGTPNQQYMKNVKENYVDFPEISPTQWHHVLGEKVQQQFIDLIQKILTYDTKNRLTPYQALLHPYFKQIPTYTNLLEKLPYLLDFQNLLNSQNSFEIETLQRIYKREVNRQNKVQSMISTFCAE